MQRLPPLPSIQEIIRIYGLSAKKKLSQNFLLDLNLTKKIVRSAGKMNNAIIFEVGPGPGGITRPLLNIGAKKVIVIEKDGRFLPSLQILSEASNNVLEVVHGDIMSTDLQTFVPQEFHTQWEKAPPNVHIIGNLPFSVSTPLIIQWLNCISKQSSVWRYGRIPLTLTFQKEVAERIVAPPKSEYRCRLSIMCQNWCDVELKFTISGKAFVPPPKVDVGVVRFVPKVEPLIKQNFTLVEKLNRHLFHLPNKYVTKSLNTLFPLDREDLSSDLLDMSGISPESRPFELSIEDINKLCITYEEIVRKEPDIFDYDFRSRLSALHRKNQNIVLQSLEERLLSNSDEDWLNSESDKIKLEGS